MRRVIPIVPVVDPSANEGWRRVSTLSEPRLSEMAQNYRDLGYEVRIEALPPRCDEDCTACLDADRDLGKSIGTLYVRGSAGPAAADELFD